MSEAAKSSNAFRTISEVSDDLGVPQHVLRFWETKFSSIRPMKRGGNRRYYRPEDIQLLRAINKLLYIDGYTIRGVQKLIRDQGVKELAAQHGGAMPTDTDDDNAHVSLEVVSTRVVPNGIASQALVEAEVVNKSAMEFEPDPSTEQPVLFMPLPERDGPKPEVLDAIAKLQKVRTNIQSALRQAG